MSDCTNCTQAAVKEHWGGYSMSCFACRERFLMDEQCKVMRETYAKLYAKWGDVPEWKKEPHCGCSNACKRRQYMRDGAQRTGKQGNAKF